MTPKIVSFAASCSAGFQSIQPGATVTGPMALSRNVRFSGLASLWLSGAKIYSGGHPYTASYALATGVLTVTWGDSNVLVAASKAFTGGASNTDHTITSRVPGWATNYIKVQRVAGTGENAALALSVSSKPAPGETLITATLATGAGTKQVETATAAGTCASDGKIVVTVTSTGMTGTPLSIPFTVSAESTAVTWAAQARAALARNAIIAARFTVGGTGTEVSLTRKVAAANDTALNIAFSAGSPDPANASLPIATSANTTAGVAPAVTTTAAQLKAAIEANTLVNSLIAMTHDGGSSGAGVLAPCSATALTGGRDEGLVTGGDGYHPDGAAITGAPAVSAMLGYKLSTPSNSAAAGSYVTLTGTLGAPSCRVYEGGGVFVAFPGTAATIGATVTVAGTAGNNTEFEMHITGGTPT